MLPIAADAVLQPGPDLLTSALSEEEVVILDPKQGIYFSLDHVGAAVWHHLVAAPRTFDDLVAFVAAHYEVAVETCRGDLEVLVKDLLDQDLLHLQKA